MSSFIVVLITLLVERFFDWSHLRKWSWYSNIEKMVLQKIPSASPYALMAGGIVPIIIALVVVDTVLRNVLYGFPFLIFQVLVLLYCFGPRNLWADTFASINANPQPSAAVQMQQLNQLFIMGNQRIFAVVFWFMLLGLPGAVLYRLASVTAEMSSGTTLNAAGKKVVDVLDWVPARILAFLFALAGHFTRVLNCWRRRAMAGLDGNDLVLTECGIAAITEQTDVLPQDTTIEKSAVSLLDRVFIITLVVVFLLAFAQ